MPNRAPAPLPLLAPIATTPQDVTVSEDSLTQYILVPHILVLFNVSSLSCRQRDGLHTDGAIRRIALLQ